MAGETECQTSETVNELKRKIAWPDLYCCNDLVSVGQKPTRTKAHWDKSPLGQKPTGTKAH